MTGRPGPRRCGPRQHRRYPPEPTRTATPGAGRHGSGELDARPMARRHKPHHHYLRGAPMKRTPMRRRARLRAKTKLRRMTPLERTASMTATDAQRAAVAGRTCIVCGSDRRIDPAHLLSASRRDGECVLPARSLIDMSARVEDETSRRVFAVGLALPPWSAVGAGGWLVSGSDGLWAVCGLRRGDGAVASWALGWRCFCPSGVLWLWQRVRERDEGKTR